MRVLTLFEAPFVTQFEADFRFRFRCAVVGSGKRKWERDGRMSPGRVSGWSGDSGEPIAVGIAHEAAFVGQGGQALVEGAVAHAAQRTQFADR
jgi:hypothetical protein